MLAISATLARMSSAFSVAFPRCGRRRTHVGLVVTEMGGALRVINVVPGSPAWLCKKLRPGDWIVTAGEVPVSTVAGFREAARTAHELRCDLVVEVIRIA